MKSNEQLLPVARAGERLGISTTTVRRMINEGTLHALVVRGRLRVPSTSIDQYIASLERASAKPDHRAPLS